VGICGPILLSVFEIRRGVIGIGPSWREGKRAHQRSRAIASAWVVEDEVLLRTCMSERTHLQSSALAIRYARENCFEERVQTTRNLSTEARYIVNRRQ